jgi:hypothetical protein
MSEIQEIIEKKHPGKLFLTVKEASDLCSLNAGTIYNQRSKGQETPFKIRKMAGKLLVPISEILRIAG